MSKRKDEGVFHCQDVRTMSKAEFIEFFQDNVMQSLVASTAVQGWRMPSLFGCSAQSWKEGKVEETQHYINALHTANLLLQKRTKAYALVTGAEDKKRTSKWEHIKGMSAAQLNVSLAEAGEMQEKTELTAGLWQRLVEVSRSGSKKRRELMEKSEDPTFMLDFGPVGDLPLHLAFLFGKTTLGRDMISCVKESPEWWQRCEELVKKWGQSSMPELPPEDDRNTKTLRSWILNIPYQNDIRWWLDEFERREARDDESWWEVNKACQFRKRIPKDLHRGIYEDDSVGKFTGETMLHIAIAQRNHELLDFLLSHGVQIGGDEASARGIFFQPRYKDARDAHVGTYYGTTPLSFAASIGDAKLMDKLTVYCKNLVLKGLDSGWRPPRAGVKMWTCVCQEGAGGGL
jgi:hypothetical protein